MPCVADGYQLALAGDDDDDDDVTQRVTRTGIPCVADAYQLTLDADELGEAQREPLERLRARFEQALRDIEERWRHRVADLEAQLCGQPEVDKDSIDCAQSTIAKLQDELSMRNVLAERLRADVTALQNQLAQQREQLASELAAREHEVALLGEQKRASETAVQTLQAKLDEVQKKAAEEHNNKSEAWNTEREALLANSRGEDEAASKSSRPLWLNQQFQARPLAAFRVKRSPLGF
ncbi:hypothetical protein HPB51_001460 [Rhipicephalus microplus]|uniref:Uncharacterized protein n=1 Tax=Rhipicephalus microplus TaxID=6941 RepID=A0A9J6DYE0_RHIMP|nr:hypothetical protein HPB51_001460 [Rhipicephalus microplus]